MQDWFRLWWPPKDPEKIDERFYVPAGAQLPCGCPLTTIDDQEVLIAAPFVVNELIVLLWCHERCGVASTRPF